MKHKASVIFSGGSKQDAHNLDDLRERWKYRRQVEAEFFGRTDTYEHDALMPFVEPTSESDAEDLYQRAARHFAEITVGLTAHKAIVPHHIAWEIRRNVLAAESGYYSALCSIYKSIVKRNRFENGQREDQSLPRLRIRQLEDLLKTYNIPLPPWPSEEE